jgi:hypothetical protein
LWGQEAEEWDGVGGWDGADASVRQALPSTAAGQLHRGDYGPVVLFLDEPADTTTKTCRWEFSH